MRTEADTVIIAREEVRLARANLFRDLERQLNHAASLVRTRKMRAGGVPEALEEVLEEANADRALLDVVGWESDGPDERVALAGHDERGALTRVLRA
jgi:hypothetical protein